jgi:hypothetical protein
MPAPHDPQARAAWGRYLIHHAIAKVPVQLPAAVTPTPMSSRDASHGFSRSLRARVAGAVKKAAAQGSIDIVINSGQLYRSLGGYPGSTHGMPACCDAMRSEMKPGDILLVEQASGPGMTVRYQLPRPQ